MDRNETILASVTAATGIAGAFATVITWIVSRSSKPEMQAMSHEDLNSLRRIVDGLISSYTTSQIATAEIKKDVQHILEKMEAIEERMEKDHEEVKKATRILMPLLQEEIAAQRKRMGLDGLSPA